MRVVPRAVGGLLLRLIATLVASAVVASNDLCSNGLEPSWGKCAAYADIVLVVDASKSIIPVFDNMTQVMLAYIDAYELDATAGAQIGIIEFRGCDGCSTPEVTTTLSSPNTDRAALVSAVEGRAPAVNATCVSCGLEVARSMLLSHNRSGAIPLVVLISDGVQSVQGGPAKAADTAANLKAAGIRSSISPLPSLWRATWICPKRRSSFPGS